MYKLNQWLMLSVFSFASALAVSDDNMKTMPIYEALKLPEAEALMAGSIQFHFGNKPENVVGNNTSTQKAYRKVARSKPDSCHRAFIEAMQVLKELAISKGSQSVVNIASNFDNKPVMNKETYLCSMSLLSAEVNLKGEVLWGEASANTSANTLDAASIPSSASTPPTSGSIEDRLKTLKNLLESGAIDQQTYDSKKAQILESL